MDNEDKIIAFVNKKGYTGGDNELRQLIRDNNRALLERIRSELPEKKEVRHKMFGNDLIEAYSDGFDKALDDVTAVLTAIEGEMK